MLEIPAVEAVPAKPLERREVVVVVRRRKALGRATAPPLRARIDADMMGWSYMNLNKVVKKVEKWFDGVGRE